MKQKSNSFDYDAIVIGSGLGGLSTASLLTKILKKKVLVLERHYEIGGLTHEFKRGPYSWDVGLHYVGNLTTRPLEKIGFKLFNYITDGKIKWNMMPEIFERFYLPNKHISIEKGTKKYGESLMREFPHAKKEIKRYIKDIHTARIWFIAYFFSNFIHNPFRGFIRLIMKINSKFEGMTTEEYLNRFITDKELRTALAIRWGNYGVPPTESAFVAHAVTEHHYYEGGMFPDGGAEKIATFIEQTIENHGGKILVSRDVEEILIKNNSAYGVRVKNLASKEQETTEYYAPIIISSAGAKTTYLKLLPELNLPIQKDLANYPDGYSAICLYLGLKDSPKTIGIEGENLWISNTNELDFFKDEAERQINGKAQYCFLSLPSLKSGTKSNHTADVVSIFPYSFFKKWENEDWKKRDNSYYELKEQLTDSLINLLDSKVPGFKDLIVYREMATPLTFKHFTNKCGGEFYGLPSIPKRYSLDLRVKTPIKNLYLSGTDLLCDGILPALNSGMATVSYIMGPLGIMKLMNKVFAYNPKKNKPKEHFIKEQKGSEDKQKAVVVSKTGTNHLQEITFQCEKELNLIGGQHVKLYVAHGEWRAYSIAKVDKDKVTLVIDTRPKGHGANYAAQLSVGDKAILRLPITDLIYHDSENEIVFIATGTGLIPFLHILDELKKNNQKKKVTVLFGCLYESDDFTEHYLANYKDFFDINLVVYVEKPETDSKYLKGRVTNYIKESTFNPKNQDFYICGHPHMTENMVKLLRKKGATRVYY